MKLFINILTDRVYDNCIIINELYKWQKSSPRYSKIIQIDTIRKLIGFADYLSYKIPDNKIIIDFIAGLMGVDLIVYSKSFDVKNEFFENFNRLTQPMFDIMLSFLRNEFQDELIKSNISEDTKINIGSFQHMFTHQGLKKYINNINALPLTVIDILQLEENLMKLKKEQFEKLTAKEKKNKGNQIFTFDLSIEKLIFKKKESFKAIKEELSLQINASKKGRFAALAFVIYESGWVNNNISYSEWIKIFSKDTNREPPTHKGKQLQKEVEKLINTPFFDNKSKFFLSPSINATLKE